MNNRRNYYRILNVQPDAPAEVIRASYRTMMQRLKMHPDLGGDARTAAVINEAYRTLIDVKARSAYDRQNLDSEWAHYKRRSDGDGEGSGAVCRCAFCAYRYLYGEEEQAADSCVNCHSPLAPLVPMAADGDDRRSVMRMRKQFTLAFYTHWPQRAACEGRVEDLCPNGIRFHCGTAVACGQVLKIESAVLDAVVRVARSEGSAGGWDVGASFVSVRFRRIRGTFLECKA
ncbi:MAG: J domain-containing protein [Halioglobus sp.]|nr:J domain-containing protein [Halioglobus sp.]